MGVYHVSKLTFRSCSLCGGNLLQARLVLLLGGGSGGGDGGLQGVPRHAPRRQSQGPKTSLYGAPHVEPTSYICTRGPEGLKNQALIFRFLGLLRTFPNHFFFISIKTIK